MRESYVATCVEKYVGVGGEIWDRGDGRATILAIGETDDIGD